MNTRSFLLIAALLFSGTCFGQSKQVVNLLPDFFNKTQCSFVASQEQLLIVASHPLMLIGARAAGTRYVVNGRVVGGCSLAAQPYYSNPIFGPGTKTFYADQIEKMPYTNIEDIVSFTTNTYQQRTGGAVQMGGAR